ncbi:GNAT family N-acetyltransferase [Lentzea sp. NPDC051213]|uniref:GNAT family N-acetyltransferase n=1 Tax=Lentzea sp. NPDC051213 TaxID=3364126 RepID=UPI00378EC790
MRPAYPLKTARLILRPFEEGDLDDFHAYRSREEVTRYVYDEPSDRADATRRLTNAIGMSELTEEGDWLVMAVYSPEAERVIGDVVLKWLNEKERQGELGYIFNPEFQGKGFAREASEAILSLGFDELGLHRMTATCDPRNEPSWRLMERLGMRREAHFRECEKLGGEWADLLVYAILAEEYRSRADEGR